MLINYNNICRLYLLPGYLIFTIILICGSPFISFTSDTGSLEKKLAEATDDTARAGIWVKLAWAYSDNDYQKAIDCCKKALELSVSIGNKKIAASAHNALGAAYYQKSDFPMAIDHYLQSLRFREERGDTTGIAASYSNIGSVYYSQGNIAKAIEFFNKSLLLKRLIHDTKGIAYSLSTIGVIYYERKDLDSAELYFTESLLLFERLGENVGKSQNYANLGVLYKDKKEYIKAFDYSMKSLVYDSLDNDVNGMMTSYINLADILRLMDRTGEAIKYQKKVLQMAFDQKNFEYIKFAYIGISASYESMHQPDSSLKYYKLYSDYRDSLFSFESSRQIHELQTRYGIEKKEKENKLLLTEKEVQSGKIKQQRLIILFILAGAILLFVLAFFIYRGYLMKKKANLELQRKNNTISRQKQEIEKQKSEIEEKNRNITDSIQYAQRIQEAILPADDILKDVFPESFILYKPKDIVCGDFYFFARVENQLIFSVIDCTGHGVPGALMCMIANDLLHEIVSDKSVTTCSKVLEDLDIKLMHVLNPGAKITNIRDGMDIAFCAFDFNRKVIQYSAANRPLLIVRNGKLIEYKADHKAIGGGDSGQKKFTNNLLETQPGDMLYLFTDGFADQIGGPKEKKFMTRQLKELLVDISGNDTAFQKTILEKTFEHWKGEGEQLDDVTVMGIRI